ncbi:MAG: M28 family peptidase, partial [Lachnospiraceae bacterium]|nr:M28 family peptidase [Lachnospiraceae bacterium]
MNDNKKKIKKLSSKQIISLLLIAVVCLMFALSMTDTIETRKKSNLDYDRIMGHVAEMVKNGPHSLYDKDANRAVMDYMISQLESYGVTEGDTINQPSYFVQDYVVESDTYQNWYLPNLIVHIPANSAEATGDAVMVMAHFDSVPMGPGASDDITACSVMLEAIRFYQESMADGTEITNDLIFCFVNGEEFALYGSEAFM